MPSLVVAANTTAQQVAAERYDSRFDVESMTIDNDGGAADQEIQVVDSFTPAATNGDSSPSAQTITRWRTTVPAGFTETYNKDDLKGVRCLGALTILGDSIDANCHITVGYEPD